MDPQPFDTESMLVRCTESYAYGYMDSRCFQPHPMAAYRFGRALPILGDEVFRTEAEARGWCMELFMKGRR